MARVIEQVRQVAATRAPVLIEGEEGTGRARLAALLHHTSPRRAAPFVRVHCASLPPTLLEQELFGVEGEAASDADRGPGERARRAGAFELAEHGTLYIEEIERLSPAGQLRLLRALQERAVERVGGRAPLKIDVRVVAATAVPLADEVSAGRFRDDLCARLSLVCIRMPPLRERAEDLAPLIAGFIREFNREHGRRVTGVTAGALERIARHAWPGNVRELRNTIEGMVVFAEGRRALDLSDLPQSLRQGMADRRAPALIAGMTVEEAERELISATLLHTGYDKTRAATMLGIGLRTLYRKIKRYGLPERSPGGRERG
jgi:DNA-binding NtrC family response regulator